jgi:hypothetical protein
MTPKLSIPGKSVTLPNRPFCYQPLNRLRMPLFDISTLWKKKHASQITGFISTFARAKDERCQRKCVDPSKIYKGKLTAELPLFLHVSQPKEVDAIASYPQTSLFDKWHARGLICVWRFG